MKTAFVNGVEIPYCKIGPVEMSLEDACKCYQQNLYIVTYTKIYQVCYSAAYKDLYYGMVVYQLDRKKGEVGFSRRGRHYVCTAKEVNDLLRNARGIEQLLNE